MSLTQFLRHLLYSSCCYMNVSYETFYVNMVLSARKYMYIYIIYIKLHIGVVQLRARCRVNTISSLNIDIYIYGSS